MRTRKIPPPRVPDPPYWPLGHRFTLLVVFASVLMVAPLWAVRDLPMVDMPQHLYVLDVLARLGDPATAYGDWFVAGFRATPYIAYYGAVHTLDALLPLEVANKLFLTFVVLGWPTSIALLLYALDRPMWPALLASAFLYSDSFGWGFVNTLAGVPLATAALACFTLLLRDRGSRILLWCAAAGLGLATLAMHPVPLLIIAAGTLIVPVALSGEPGRRAPLFRRVLIACSAWLPAVVLGIAWLSSRVASGGGLGSGAQPHETIAANLSAFPWLLGNLMRDGSQAWAILGAAVVFALTLVWSMFGRAERNAGPSGAAWVFPLLALSTLGAFFAMPLSLQPDIQYLSPRFAPIAAAFIAAAVPRVGRLGRTLLPAIALSVPLLAGIAAYNGFLRFDSEAAALHRLASRLPPRSRILSLAFAPGSATIHHPVFLHGAATLARLTGGVPSYNLAGWSQSPIHWKGAPLIGTATEWDVAHFDFAAHGRDYDAILLRGGDPSVVPESWAESVDRSLLRDGMFTLLLRQAEPTDSIPMRHEAP